MIALVTGSHGFLGRHFAAELARRGWIVVGYDPLARKPLTGDAMELFGMDTDPGAFDLVVHAAARGAHRGAIDTRPEDMAYNAMLDAAMFHWAIRTRQRGILYISSAAAYPAELQEAPGTPGGGARLAEWRIHPDAGASYAGEPVLPADIYGWHKLTGERMARQANQAGIPTHVVRPFSGYGADQGEDWPFGAFVARARRRDNPFTIWGSGRQVRDWIHVSDVVAGALAVVGADVREPVNLCTGIGTSMRELAEMVCREAGYTPEIAFLPAAPAGVDHRVGDPGRMLGLYTPRVSLGEGIRLAFAEVTA